MIDSVDGRGYDMRVDCFSYGLLLYVFLTGLTPAEAWKRPVCAWDQNSPGTPPRFPSGGAIPPALTELVERLWSQAPRTRPDFDAVCEALVSDRALWLPGTNETEFLAYVEWVTTDTFGVIVDGTRYERRMDLRLTGSQVKQLLSKEFGQIAQLKSESGIVDDTVRVENFFRGDLTVVRGVPIETVVDIRARCAQLYGIPAEYIIIWQNDSELCDSPVAGQFAVKIRVTVHRVPDPVVVDPESKVERIYADLEMWHDIAPPFRLLSAGREVEPKEGLAGLAFPLDLETGVVFTFRRLNSRDVIR
jgi:hypothetical protein